MWAALARLEVAETSRELLRAPLAADLHTYVYGKVDIGQREGAQG